jgi:hypothetical protein
MVVMVMVVMVMVVVVLVGGSGSGNVTTKKMTNLSTTGHSCILTLLTRSL